MPGYERTAWSVVEEAEDVQAGDGAGEPRSGPCVGIKALMLAILEDAMRAYLGGGVREREEAALWMANGRSQWVFSFPVVCETLGLEPAAVRAAVIRMRRRGPLLVSHTRSRPNSRRHARVRAW